MSLVFAEIEGLLQNGFAIFIEQRLVVFVENFFPNDASSEVNIAVILREFGQSTNVIG